MYKSRREIQISRRETDFIALPVIFVSAPVVSVGLMGGFFAVAVVLIAVPVTPVVVPWRLWLRAAAPTTAMRRSPAVRVGGGASAWDARWAFDASSDALFLHFDDVCRWQFAVAPLCLFDDGFGQLAERHARHGVVVDGSRFAFVSAFADALHNGDLRQ